MRLRKYDYKIRIYFIISGLFSSTKFPTDETPGARAEWTTDTLKSASSVPVSFYTPLFDFADHSLRSKYVSPASHRWPLTSLSQKLSCRFRSGYK